MADLTALEDPVRTWSLRYVHERDPDFTRPEEIVAPLLDALFVLAPRLFTPLALEMDVSLFDVQYGFRDGLPEQMRWRLEVDSPDVREGADWTPAETRMVVAAIDRAAIERFVRSACDQPAPEGTAVCPSALYVREIRAPLPNPWARAESPLVARVEGGTAHVKIARDAAGDAFVVGPEGPIITPPLDVMATAEGLEAWLSIQAYWSPWYEQFAAGRDAVDACVEILEARGWRIDRRTANRRGAVAHELLESGAGAARYRGHAGGRPQERRLITVGGAPTIPRAELERSLALRVEGVMPLDYFGPVDEPDERIGWTGYCLVEVEPAGRPLSELSPLSEAEGVALGLQLLDVVTRAHARGLVVAGIRPELVYCDRDEGGRIRLTGLAPRAQLFLITTRPAHGVPVLPDLYLAPEALNFAPVAASDVFSTCATIYSAISGRHPLGDGLPNQLVAMTAGRVEPFAGSRWLGDVLTQGLATAPAARPRVDELAARLARGLETGD